MSERPPELGKGTDIDTAKLDVEAPIAEPSPTSDAEEYTEDGETLGGTGGLDAGGAG